MVTTTTRPESREDALIRLADQARASGVKLYQDRADGRFYASSRSQPGTFHRLTGFSCSCQGFIRHGRCAHLAALHSALGWLETPEPTPPAETAPIPAPCAECGGNGEVPGLGTRQFSSWATTWETCRSCHGAGRIAA